MNVKICFRPYTNSLKLKTKVKIKNKTKQEKLMKMTYNKSVESYYRGKKIAFRLIENFYWPNMLQDYKNQSKICRIYQKTKAEKVGKYGNLILVKSPKKVQQKIALNLVIDLFKIKNQKNAILVIIDILSKIIKLIPTKKELSSKKLVYLLINNIVALFRMSKEIISDNNVRIIAKT